MSLLPLRVLHKLQGRLFVKQRLVLISVTRRGRPTVHQELLLLGEAAQEILPKERNLRRLARRIRVKGRVGRLLLEGIPRPQLLRGVVALDGVTRCVSRGGLENTSRGA